MTDRELLQQALDALNKFDSGKRNHGMLWQVPVIEAIKARLAQPEPEPVAWISHNAGLYHGKPDESLNPLPLYTAPPNKEWVGLTDDEIKNSMQGYNTQVDFARAIEAKLKEKNT